MNGNASRKSAVKVVKRSGRVEECTALEKTPSGIRGLDEITEGGLPKGRPTLLCGTAGSGKTMLAMEFLVRGAQQYGEPGVFLAFEETESELTKNCASLGFNLQRLIGSRKLRLDYVRVERGEIEETGEYDLEGLFVRLGDAIDSIGAKRVVLDTIEVLFAGLTNAGIIRSELRRLLRWLKDKGVTAIVTAERGSSTLTRHGLEEYVADCVIVLDHRVTQQIPTRRMRIVKYRGSAHGNNEYPFLIEKTGISVLPVTSVGLSYRVSTQRISTGVPRLDTMLGGGYYRASTVLLSGAAGTGKTSLAASFVAAACRRGERCLYFAYEEAPDQIVRNMRSIGCDLQPWIRQKKLLFNAMRPTVQGLEGHLASALELIRQFRPSVVVLDPLTSLRAIGEAGEVTQMLARLIDFVKVEQITLLATSLTEAKHAEEQSEVAVSSLIDTWLLVRNLESNGERNRGLYILKSRGTAHSNQVREFVLSDAGIELVDVYTGTGQVLTGSARLAQLERERMEQVARREEADSRRLELERRRLSTHSQITALEAEIAVMDGELKRIHSAGISREKAANRSRLEIARSRHADMGAAS